MDWKLVYSVFRDVLLVGFFLYTVWANREKVNAKKFKNLETQVADKQSRDEAKKSLSEHEERCRRHREQTVDLAATLRGLQSEVNHLPSRSEIKGLNDNITDLAGKMGKLEGRLEGINRAADLMNEFLINQGGKK